MDTKLISFVIPVYASEKSVSLVIDEIRNVISQKSEYDYEIIAVNDFSPDNVMRVLREEAINDKKVKVIDLAKNRGRHNALICGCHYTSGEYITFVDDDLQCPMDRFWDLLEPIESGNYDVSIARYPRKKQSIIKNAGSKLNDVVSNILLKKDRDLRFSNFSIMKKYIKDEVIRYSNPYPYMSGLFIRATDRVINVDMEERERTIGIGHYTFKKSLALWMNNLTAFSVVPLRMATTIGIIFAMMGFLMTLIIVIRKILIPDIAMGYSSTMAVIIFVGGMIMLMLGIMGEYVGRIYISLNNAPQYVVREKINIDEVNK